MNTPDIDLNAVAILAKVIEAGSFRGAAKALDVPRSTVSLKVARLESQVGVRLVERTTRTLRATEAGNAYLRTAGPALEALAEAGREAADRAVEPSGTLRVTAPPELGQVLFGRVLSVYRARYPAVRVEADLTARRVDLPAENIDLAVRAGELSDSTLICRAIGAGGAMVACAAPDYLRRRGTPRHPADLAGHDCLVMSARQSPTRWVFRDGGKRTRVEVTPAVSINSFLVLRDLAAAGHGIARIPAFLLSDQLADGSLREVLSAFAMPETAFHALYPPSGKLSAKLQGFVTVLEEEMRAL